MQLDPLAFVGDFAREGVSTLPQIAFNVVLFMPLGFIAGRLLRWGFWKSVIVGLLVSLVIETAQGTGLFGIYPYAYRTADVDDLIYNTSGAALGWACAAALARVLPPGALAEESEVTHTPGFVRRCVAFWLDMLLVTLVSLVVGGVIGLVLAMLGASERVRAGRRSTCCASSFSAPRTSSSRSSGPCLRSSSSLRGACRTTLSKPQRREGPSRT